MGAGCALLIGMKLLLLCQLCVMGSVWYLSDTVCDGAGRFTVKVVLKKGFILPHCLLKCKGKRVCSAPGLCAGVSALSCLGSWVCVVLGAPLAGCDSGEVGTCLLAVTEGCSALPGHRGCPQRLLMVPCSLVLRCLLPLMGFLTNSPTLEFIKSE